MSDFLTVRQMDVIFQYTKVNQGYMFDSTARKSVPCQASAPGAAWSIGFLVSNDEARVLWEKAKAHFNDCKARNSKLGEFQAIHSYKANDGGTVTFNAKRKCMTSKGYPAKEIRIVDGMNKPLEDKAFWTCSTGNVKFAMWPSHNQSNDKWGISLMLESVQVVKAVYGEGDGDSGDDWGVVAGATPTAADMPMPASIVDAVSNIGKDINDEIPF